MLVSPSTPTTAFRIGERADDPMAMYLADLCTIPSDLAGNAALSVPCGLADEDGLPVGLQVMAPVLADDRPTGWARRWRRRWASDGGTRCWTRRRAWTSLMTETMAELVSFDDAVARYDPLIGLETHVELGTESKMFCGCPTRFGADPNTQVCPVCLGLPGSLPVTNAAAIEFTIRIGLALNCSIAQWCRFARKNYFYPDMPKNYQISQYDEPLCTDGWLDVTVHSDGAPPRQVRVEIERVHLEEDTGKSLHKGGATGRIHGADYSLVDYNRAGIPLVEIVTKPVTGTGALAPAGRPRLRHRAAGSAPRARRVRRPDGRGLAALRREHLAVAEGLRGLGDQDRDQERELAPLGRAGGQLRDRAAGSAARRRPAHRPGDQALPRGHRDDHRRAQQGRGAGLPVLPRARPGADRPGPGVGGAAPRHAARASLGAPRPPAVRVGPVRPGDGGPGQRRRPRPRRGDRSGRRDPRRRAQVVARRAPPAANAKGTELSALGITPAQVARVSELVTTGALNDKLARQVLDAVLAGEGSPDDVIAARGLAIVRDDTALLTAVDEAIAANPEVADKIRGGKTAAAAVLLGAVMQATRGQADAERVRELILERLS